MSVLLWLQYWLVPPVSYSAVTTQFVTTKCSTSWTNCFKIKIIIYCNEYTYEQWNHINWKFSMKKHKMFDSLEQSQTTNFCNKIQAITFDLKKRIRRSRTALYINNQTRFMKIYAIYTQTSQPILRKWPFLKTNWPSSTTWVSHTSSSNDKNKLTYFSLSKFSDLELCNQ